MTQLPNKNRNDQVQGVIDNLKGLSLGPQTEAHTSYASVLASQNIAESLQLLQLQLAESSTDNKKALHDTTDKLITSNVTLAKSNDRHATAMQWLTGALLLVGIAQVVVAFITH